MSSDKKHTLSVGDISRLLGWSPRFIESLVRAENIPFLEVNGQPLFERQDVIDWLDQKINTLDDGHLSELEQSLESGDSTAEGDAGAPVQRFADAFNADVIGADLKLSSKRTVVEALVELAQKGGKVQDGPVLLASVLQREALHSTALPGGVAICHPRRPLPAAVSGLAVAFIRTSEPVLFGADGEQEPRLFFLLAAADERTHLYALSKIARLLRPSQTLAKLLSAELTDAAQISAYLKDALTAQDEG